MISQQALQQCIAPALTLLACPAPSAGTARHAVPQGEGSACVELAVVSSSVTSTACSTVAPDADTDGVSDGSCRRRRRSCARAAAAEAAEPATGR